MRNSLPLIAAILAGASVLAASLSAVLYRVPDFLLSQPAQELVVTGIAQADDGLGVSAGFITLVIVFLSLAGLTVLFFIEVLNPKGQRRVQGGSRGVNDLIDALKASEGRRR